MNVLHVIESLGIGGAEQMLTVLLPALQQYEVQASVAVMRGPTDLRDTLEAAGINVHLLPKRYKWNLPGYALDLARLAKQHDIDILHAHLYFPAVCTALVRLLKLHSAATVVTFHNLAYAAGVNKHGLGLRIKKLLAAILYPRAYDKKIAVSRAVAQHYALALGLEQLIVIFNPVDIEAIDRLQLQPIEPVNTPLHIVLPGRLVHEKGHDILLQAMMLLRTSGRELRATFAGGGPLHESLLSNIEQCSLRDWVMISGSLRHQTMLETIASADIVVIPSRYEGLGLTAIESMALAKPVIVTSAGGLSEIVEDGISGKIVPAQNPAELAAAINELIASSSYRAGLGRSARLRIEQKFALPGIAQTMSTLYKEILLSRTALGEQVAK